jgi:hypothetical protein
MFVIMTYDIKITKNPKLLFRIHKVWKFISSIFGGNLANIGG